MFKKLLVCILGLTQFLQADFIAFRKLIHPKTNKIVYILYDIHATKVFNPLSEDEKIKEHENLKEEYDLSLKFKRTGTSVTTNHPDGLFPDKVIDNYIKKFRETHLRNLIKQQKALIKIVKTDNVSLINEDWNNEESATQSIGKIKYLEVLTKELGLTRKTSENKIFQLGGNSPMRGLSKKLKKHFSQATTSAYSNIDHRTTSYAPEERESQKVDRAIIETLNFLLKNPDHKSVIIAAGATHSAYSAKSLIEIGYVSKAFIVSDNLAAKKDTNKEIQTILNNLEYNHVFIDMLADNVVYELIEDPLDLIKVFKEKKVKF